MKGDLSDAWCVNFFCDQPQNPAAADICQSCGSSLILNERYKLRERLKLRERGSKTEVFLAEDISSHELKVLKLIRTRLDKEIELFEREAYALQHLVSKGLPDSEILSDFKEQLEYGMCRCIVMEYIPGLNLSEWLSNNRLTEDDQVIDWLRQMAETLHTMHTSGFFHRDIKPQNIILSDEGRLVLVDLGAVRDTTNTYLSRIALDPDDQPESKGITRIFTYGYAPPEQLEYRAIPQSDFYALGKTFIHLLTGVEPGDLPKDEQTGKSLWRGLAPTISPPVADLIDQLCETLPIHRPHTTSVLLEQIKHLPAQVRRYRLVRQPLLWLTVGVSILAVVLGLAEGGRRWYVHSQISVGREAMHLESYIDARQRFESAAYWDSKNADIRYDLARSCSFLGDDECTIREYEATIVLEPGNTELLFVLGDYYEQLGDIPKAKTTYQRAIDVAPKDSIKARNNLARLVILDGQYAKALSILGNAPEASEPSPALRVSWHKNRAWALKELGRRADAIQSLELALSIDELDISANCLMGEILNRKQHWEVCLMPPTKLPEINEWRKNFIDRSIID